MGTGEISERMEWIHAGYSGLLSAFKIQIRCFYMLKVGIEKKQNQLEKQLELSS